MKPLIELPDHIDGCWRWTGSINPKTGYGKKQFDGHSILAHRWVYSVFNGHIPDGLHIDHLCRNRWCVNPSHLEAVTQAENCRRGVGTKLTREDVKAIKLALPSVKWGGRKELAAKYGVSDGLISNIKYGRAWADV